MPANDQQVGGNHYKVSYEHWDVLLDLDRGVDYLIGHATKYVARWRKKNGVQDLEKALHFTNKLIDNKHKIFYRDPHPNLSNLIDRFAAANGLTNYEATYCELMISLTSEDALYKARDLLVMILEEADRDRYGPVPLSDSNKHADRA